MIFRAALFCGGVPGGGGQSGTIGGVGKGRHWGVGIRRRGDRILTATDMVSGDWVRKMVSVVVLLWGGVRCFDVTLGTFGNGNLAGTGRTQEIRQDDRAKSGTI